MYVYRKIYIEKNMDIYDLFAFICIYLY
jgi:hypothetical protein